MGDLKRFEQFKTGAVKDVKGKLRLDLIPPEMLEGLANLLGYGVNKYAERNWEHGINFMTHYGSAMRHLTEWLKGHDLDPESNQKHIEAAFINIGMIVTQVARGRSDLDDRPSITGALQKEGYSDI